MIVVTSNGIVLDVAGDVDPVVLAGAIYVDSGERKLAVAIADSIDGRYVHGLGGYVTATEHNNRIRVSVNGTDEEEGDVVLNRFTISVTEELALVS